MSFLVPKPLYSCTKQELQSIFDQAQNSIKAVEHELSIRTTDNKWHWGFNLGGTVVAYDTQDEAIEAYMQMCSADRETAGYRIERVYY